MRVNCSYINTSRYRTDLLLGLGIGLFAFVTPCLQIALAYMYFKKGHIWSRVLNPALEGINRKATNPSS